MHDESLSRSSRNGLVTEDFMTRYSFRHRPIIGIFVCIALLSGTCLAGLIGVVALRRFRLTHFEPGVSKDHFGGRELLVYEPYHLPAVGKRALVVVLHGGLGNAAMIEGGLAERGLKMDAVAEKDGFLVAYLNGTKVARLLGRHRSEKGVRDWTLKRGDDDDADDVRNIRFPGGNIYFWSPEPRWSVVSTSEGKTDSLDSRGRRSKRTCSGRARLERYFWSGL